jgi:predicted nucleic acid-binding protein
VIAFDASVVIAFFDVDDEHHSRAHSLITREIDHDFGLNVITLAEVLVGPTRENRVQSVLDTMRDLDVAELDLPTLAATQLAQLRTPTGISLPHCCVLLTAIERGARVASFDVKLNKAAVGLGLTVVSA